MKFKKNPCRLFVILVFFLTQNTVTSFGQDKFKYDISGTIIGAEGKILYLSSDNFVPNETKVKLDSSVVADNGSFRLNGDLEYWGRYSIFFEDSKQFQTFYLDTNRVSIQGHVDTIYQSRIVGSPELSIMKEFKEKDTPIQNLIEKQLNAFQENQKNIEVARIHAGKIDSLNQIRKELIHATINENPSSYQVIELIDAYKDRLINYEEASAYLKELPKEFYNNPIYMMVNEYLEGKEKTHIGNRFPTITLSDTLGREIQIDSLLKGNNYTLIDFWASWCIPCRNNKDQLLDIYNKYSNKGFGIIGISGDTSVPAWSAAIREDNMEWSNLSDMKGVRDGAFVKAAVRVYPTYFVVDSNYNIVLKKEGSKGLNDIAAFLEKQIQ